ncbi:uncharacterized protein LOC144487148 [Mustelus asterias]
MTTINAANCRFQVERISKKIAHIDTDIKFLQTCKKADKIPKGLRITNPLRSTYNTDYAERLCRRTSLTLLKHLIHQLYSKRRSLETKIESIVSTCAQDADQLRNSAKQTRQRNYTIYMHTKNRKLEKLGITSSSNQAPPGTTVENSTTAGKSIVNLSDDTLQPDEIEVLSRGLNFCPTTKIDPISLAADTEEFIRRMRLREFFHKPQEANSEHNETANEPEQQTERPAVQPKRKESNWTPPEGRCRRLDMYAQAIRRCVNTKFISRTHKTAPNITQAQRNAIHALKTNRNIVIKPADKGAIVILNRTDYCKEVYRQLNNEEHYRQLPTDPSKNTPVNSTL